MLTYLTITTFQISAGIICSYSFSQLCDDGWSDGYSGLPALLTEMQDPYPSFLKILLGERSFSHAGPFLNRASADAGYDFECVKTATERDIFNDVPSGFPRPKLCAILRRAQQLELQTPQQPPAATGISLP